MPFLGALFGALVYLLFVAGLFILIPSQVQNVLQNQATHIANITTGGQTAINTPHTSEPG